MKFIFPRNYNFKNKILGVIDYSTAIFNLILLFLIYFLISIFIKNLSSKLLFLIIFYFPIFLLTLFCSQNESVVFMFFYIIKFLLKPKIYLYK